MQAPHVTEHLQRWRSGDQEALKDLMPLVYKELRQMAHRYLQQERSNHTLRSTAPVHEVCLRMTKQRGTDPKNRAHFIGIAAHLMRQILVDNARNRRAAKRGPNCKIELDEAVALPLARTNDIIALKEALDSLAKIDQQQSRIVELRFFGGLPTEEAAEVLDIPASTGKREWNLAKAWLSREIRRDQEAGAKTLG